MQRFLLLILILLLSNKGVSFLPLIILVIILLIRLMISFLLFFRKILFLPLVFTFYFSYMGFLFGILSLVWRMFLFRISFLASNFLSIICIFILPLLHRVLRLVVLKEF